MNTSVFMSEFKDRLTLPEEYKKDVIQELTSHISQFKFSNSNHMKQIGDPSIIANDINSSKHISTLDLLRLRSTWQRAVRYSSWFLLSLVISGGLLVVTGMLLMKFSVSGLITGINKNVALEGIVYSLVFFLPSIVSLYVFVRIIILKKIAKSRYPRQTIMSLLLGSFPYSLVLSLYQVFGINSSFSFGGKLIGGLFSFLVYTFITMLIVCVVDIVLHNFMYTQNKKYSLINRGIAASFSTMMIVGLLVVGGTFSIIKIMHYENQQEQDRNFDKADQILHEIITQIPENPDKAMAIDLDSIELSSSFGFDIIKIKKQKQTCSEASVDLYGSDRFETQGCRYDSIETVTRYSKDGRGFDVCVNDPFIPCSLLTIQVYPELGETSIIFSAGSFTCEMNNIYSGYGCFQNRWKLGSTML